MDKKSFGRKINTARKDRGMTGEKLAEACNINVTYLRQIEAGTKVPSLPVFVMICEELGVSPSCLLAEVLPESENRDIDALIKLCIEATPNQLKTITAMIRGALASIEE